MWYKAVWTGHLMRLELTHEGLQVGLANYHTTRGACRINIFNDLNECSIFMWEGSLKFMKNFKWVNEISNYLNQKYERPQNVEFCCLHPIIPLHKQIMLLRITFCGLLPPGYSWAAFEWTNNKQSIALNPWVWFKLWESMPAGLILHWLNLSSARSPGLYCTQWDYDQHSPAGHEPTLVPYIPLNPSIKIRCVKSCLVGGTDK